MSWRKLPPQQNPISQQTNLFYAHQEQVQRLSWYIVVFALNGADISEKYLLAAAEPFLVPPVSILCQQEGD